MADKPTNTPAFPSLTKTGFPLNGMTLRDYFAAEMHAQSVLDYDREDSAPNLNNGNRILPYATAGVGTREQIIARQAYRYADAMLAEREKSND